MLDDDPFDPLPGQFVAFDLVGHHEYRRSPYCLLGVEGRTFEILVRRVPQGPISQFLVGLRPDDEVGFRGPTGRSMIPRRPGPMVAFATGVGISPCLFLAESLASLPDARLPLRVFWGLRLPDDLCLEEEIARLEARGTLRVTVSLSRPPSDWHGLRGRITETVPPLLSEVADTWFYLVSNGRMVAEMRAALEEIGVDRNRIYCESFFDHRHRPDPDTVAEIVARFPPAARTGLATLSLLTGRGRDLLSRP
ncbi:MAG TPA: hypothetical protein ENK55_09880 [Actinobacteria bacterium]|nr:hypothetical protein [Actinomycetota bacterium]